MRNFSTLMAASAMSAGVALAIAEGDSKAGAKAPAKSETTEREPIAARGADLLAMIDEAGEAGLMLTQEEGLDAVNAGYAVVDTGVTEGDTAKVTLTDAGRAALTSSGNVATKFEIDDNIEMPTNTTRRGRSGGYPFENLNVGQSFHIPLKDGETPADVAARMQSSISGARARFAEVVPGEFETVKVKTYQKGSDGKFVKDAEGKRVIATEVEEQRPVTRLTRDFKVLAVTTDPKGPGARVWRIAVDEAA